MGNKTIPSFLQGKGLLIAGGILLVLGIAGIGLALGLFISPGGTFGLFVPFVGRGGLGRYAHKLEIIFP